MKILLLGLATAMFISGCATKSAFTKLEMGEEEAKAVEDTRCVKIISEDKVGGILSAIYLNNIYKDIGEKTQNFYVSIYIKESGAELNMKLNDKEPLEIKKLPSVNKYSHLLHTKNDWTKNYEVIFANTQSPDLNLSIDSGQFSSGLLSFSKELR